MDMASVNPFIRVAMRSVIPAGAEIKPRIIFDYELIFVENGEFTLNYNGRDYHCKSGDFLLFCPDIPHSFNGIQHDLSQPHIHFDLTHAPDSIAVPISFKNKCDMSATELGMIRKNAFFGYANSPFVGFSNPVGALELFRDITEKTSLSSLGRKARLTELLDMMIADNFPRLFDDDLPDYSIECAVKDYLDAGQGLSSTLEAIARQFNYSKYHLDRRFKSRYGVGIIAYRNRLKMEKAAELLRENGVSQTAEMLGYSSIYVFSRAFKNHFGYPPKSLKPAQ